MWSGARYYYTVNKLMSLMFLIVWRASQLRFGGEANTLKLIFHCDAKYLASGVGVGQCPRSQNYALETCWYILA